MSSTSDYKQFLNVQCLIKYLSKSFKTWLKLQDIRQKIGGHCYNFGPRPFNGFHEKKHNLAITRQNQLEPWDKKLKEDFS